MWEAWVGKIHWRREWLPTPIFWPGKFHRGVTKRQTWLSDFHFPLYKYSHINIPLSVLSHSSKDLMEPPWIYGPPHDFQRLKHLPAMQETWIQSLSWEDPLEKEMATHSPWIYTTQWNKNVKVESEWFRWNSGWEIQES